MYSGDPTETARYLIQHAGGVQAAHDCVTRELKQRQGRPTHNDTNALLIASAIRRHDRCKDNAALWAVANLFLRKHADAAAMVRRLRRKLNGRSLAEFAGCQPVEAVRKSPGHFAFKLRQKPRTAAFFGTR
jgi:hypothetical protein